MKRIPIFIGLILGSLTFLMAQVPVQNGSFESWTTTDLLVSFPPYESISNLASVGDGVDQNVYPITTPGNGQGVRMAPNIANGDTLVAVLGIGEFNPDKPGAPYIGTPDSFFITTRYHFQPGDNGLIAFNFFAGGSKILGPVIHFFAGTDSAWHEESLALPTFPMAADSIGILIASGDFNNSQLGSWLEIDSMYFTGTTAPIPNGQFDVTDSLSYDDPDSWLTPNLFSALFMATPSVTMTSTAAEGSYAVRIETIETETNDGIDTTSWIFLAQEIAEGIGPSGGLPIPNGAETALALTGSYQYHPIGMDTAIVYFVMTAYDSVTQQRDTILETPYLLPPATEYQTFSIPIDLAQEADSFLLAFAASDESGDFHQGPVGIGSVLILDNLLFDTTTVVNSLGKQLSPLEASIYPNPATDQVTLTIGETDPDSYEIRIFHLNGQILYRDSWTPFSLSEKAINLAALPDGILIVEVLSSTDDKRWTQRLLHR